MIHQPSITDLEINDSLYFQEMQSILDQNHHFEPFFEQKIAMIEDHIRYVRFEFLVEPTITEIITERSEHQILKSNSNYKNIITIFLWKKTMIWLFDQIQLLFSLPTIWFVDIPTLDIRINNAWEIIQKTYINSTIMDSQSKRLIVIGSPQEKAWKQRAIVKGIELNIKKEEVDKINQSISDAKRKIQNEYLKNKKFDKK